MINSRSAFTTCFWFWIKNNYSKNSKPDKNTSSKGRRPEPWRARRTWSAGNEEVCLFKYFVIPHQTYLIFCVYLKLLCPAWWSLSNISTIYYCFIINCPCAVSIAYISCSYHLNCTFDKCRKYAILPSQTVCLYYCSSFCLTLSHHAWQITVLNATAWLTQIDVSFTWPLKQYTMKLIALFFNMLCLIAKFNYRSY